MNMQRTQKRKGKNKILNGVKNRLSDHVTALVGAVDWLIIPNSMQN